MKFRKRNISRSFDQSCLQSSLDYRLEPEDQSDMQLSANSFFASTVCSFPSADIALTDNTSLTKSIEDRMSVEPIQVNQALPVADRPVQLEVELTDEAGNTTVETRTVKADQVAQRVCGRLSFEMKSRGCT